MDLVNLKSPKSITTIGYFSLNESKVYHVKHLNEKYKGQAKKPYSIENIEYDITIRVLDSTDTSYTMLMTYENYSIRSNSQKDKYQLQQSLGEMVESFDIKFVTDEFGAFDSLQNIADLQVTYLKLVDQLKAIMLENFKDKASKSEIETSFTLLRQSAVTEDFIKLLFMDDISNLFSTYGLELILNKPIELELMYPGLNGITMNGSAEILLKSIEKSRGIASYSLTKRPDQESVKAYITAIASVLLGSNMDKVADFSDVRCSIKTKCDHSMSLSTGWMSKVKIQDNTTVAHDEKKIKHVETWEYALQ
jgi:hypothetical protein